MGGFKFLDVSLLETLRKSFIKKKKKKETLIKSTALSMPKWCRYESEQNTKTNCKIGWN